MVQRQAKDGPKFESWYGQVISLIQNHPDQLQGPPSLLYHFHQGSFLGLNRPKRGFDHSRGAEDKNEWNYNSTPPPCPLVWRGKASSGCNAQFIRPCKGYGLQAYVPVHHFMPMKYPLTPAGIEPATFRFVAQ